MNPQLRQGVALSVLAMFCLASMDATGKVLTATYPIVQVMAVRFAIFLGAVLLLVGSQGRLGSLRSKMVWTQTARALCLVAEVSLFIYAFSIMPLADVHAIAAVAPLFVTLLAALFLGETIGMRRGVGVAIGFAGALIIIRPGMDVMTWQAIYPVVGTVLWAGYQVLSRRVAAVDSPETSVVFSSSIGLLVFGALAPMSWVEPTRDGWVLLLVNGLLGAAGHYVLIKALDLAPASALQPFSYSLLVWAIVVGFVTFGDFPDGFTLLGATVVIVAGLVASEAGWPMMRLASPNRDRSD